jgi:hypothetical protein
MSDTQIVLDPVAPAGTAGESAAFRPLASLDGKVVGFIDNSKPNFSFLADDLGELLRAKYGVKKVVRHRKPTASVSASPQVFADIKKKCDLVITGSGD